LSDTNGVKRLDDSTATGGFRINNLVRGYDHIGQLRTAVGTGGQSTEDLRYGYDTA